MSSQLNINEPDPSLFILNEKNQLITDEYLVGLLSRYGVKDYKITDLNTFQKAMVHTSYMIKDHEAYEKKRSKNNRAPVVKIEPIKDVNSAIMLQEKSYERLEFLGDSVLHLILAEYLFKRYPNNDEGFMTRLRTKIESSESLAKLCARVGLSKYILISKYIELTNGRVNNNSILEDAFEAFIGALMLDGGFNVCRTFMVNLMEKELDFAELIHVQTNFKDHILQYFHQMHWEDPKYGILDVSGPDHLKVYSVYIKCMKTPMDDGEIIGEGYDTSKKRAEQEAAKNALIWLKQINLAEDSDDDSVIEDSDDNSDDDNETMSSCELDMSKIDALEDVSNSYGSDSDEPKIVPKSVAKRMKPKPPSKVNPNLKTKRVVK